MTSRSLEIPPIPAVWPFHPRPLDIGLGRREGVVLPGMGPGWTLIAAKDLALPMEDRAENLAEAFGRGGVRRAGDLVLRPYRRGGWVRHINGRVYLSPLRFLRELQVHRALWFAGFPTVEPLGIAHRRCAWGVEGVYLSRLVDAEPWPRRWHPGAEAMPRLRTLVEALCAWGVFAPDLNATNVMARPTGEMLLLDWDRARWGGVDLFSRYRARLLRSLAKLQAPPEIRTAVAAWGE